MIVMKNWYKTLRPLNDFQAPELGISVLNGDVYGHPNFTDGMHIHTSCIVGIEDMGDHKEVITRSGSRYSVFPGDVLPAAERDYPGYYKRLRMEG